MKNYNTKDFKSQVEFITEKLAQKKGYNEKAVQWLKDEGKPDKAAKIKSCGEHIGITNIDGIAKIIRADFCRERLCSVCAWRRQSRFLAQMFPVINRLEAQGYRFIFVTLTMRNTSLDGLQEAVNIMIKGFDRLLKKRKIKRAWKGVCRSLELTYNEKENTFHPHIHLLVAVEQDYFMDSSLYITKTELWQIWRECLRIDYNPDVSIQATDNKAYASRRSI